MWLEKLSDKITDIFIGNDIVSYGEINDFQYGIQIILLLFIDIICLIIVGSVTGHLLEITIFSLGFSPLKINAGGYHAKTPQGCILTYLSVMYLSLFSVKLFYSSVFFSILLVIGLIISFFVLYKYAPAESINKKLTQKVKIHNRKCTFKLFTLDIFIIIIAMLLKVDIYHIYLFAIGIIIQSVSLLIKERGNTDEETNAFNSI